jgi:hypothetical protein
LNHPASQPEAPTTCLSEDQKEKFKNQAKKQERVT